MRPRTFPPAKSVQGTVNGRADMVSRPKSNPPRVIRSRKKRAARFIRGVFIIIFLCVIIYSLYQVWDTHSVYVEEQQVHQQVLQYKPEHEDLMAAAVDSGGAPEYVNESIAQLMARNPDAVGWITLDGTRIDYPFVQAGDNDIYLRQDIDRKPLYAGTLFMDYRCGADFSDFTTIIYGHNMKNGSMFSDIKRYDNAAFFADNRTGWLYLLNAAYRIEIFAYLEVQEDDAMIYGAGMREESERLKFFEHLSERAYRYREIYPDTDNNFLVLSTCASSSEEQRRVLVARLLPTI